VLLKQNKNRCRVKSSLLKQMIVHRKYTQSQHRLTGHFKQNRDLDRKQLFAIQTMPQLICQCLPSERIISAVFSVSIPSKSFWMYHLQFSIQFVLSLTIYIHKICILFLYWNKTYFFILSTSEVHCVNNSIFAQKVWDKVVLLSMKSCNFFSPNAALRQ